MYKRPQQAWLVDDKEALVYREGPGCKINSLELSQKVLIGTYLH